jgi:hypothetical protein
MVSLIHSVKRGVYQLVVFSALFSKKIYVQKHMKTNIKPKLIICALFFFTGIAGGFANANEPQTSPDEKQKIMLALLLDTSNSMDGLIEQAKSQLWRIVNELAAAKCDDGARPRIQIALYEYGNDNLPASEGYVRQVAALTSDLDLISEKLFSLRTNGGNEFCGQVISTSLRQLAWTQSKADLKLIFIAGNEPFTQGEIPYKFACDLAREKDVIVNTIFCGPYQEGIETSWKRGADLTGGTYMSIEQNERTVYIITPYDDRISALNEALNDTYVYYGTSGRYKKQMQGEQDKNAETYSQSNKVERVLSKSSHAYDNKSWDLVDGSKENEKLVEQAKADDLPAEMRSMSVPERKEYVEKKAHERAAIQKEIAQLGAQREQYLKTHSGKSETSTLDAAMMKAIRSQAVARNFKW